MSLDPADTSNELLLPLFSSYLNLHLKVHFKVGEEGEEDG